MYKCEICDRGFKNYIGLSSHIRSHKITTKEYYDKYLKKYDEGICNCGKPTNFHRLKTGYYKYCSLKCSDNSEEVKEHREQTCLKNHGVKNPSQSEEVKEKKIQTCLKNHGVEHPLQSKEVQEKQIQTNLERYGVEYTFQSEEVKEKIKEFYIDKYGVENIMQSKELIKKRSGENHHCWNPDRNYVCRPYTEKFHDEEFRNQIRQEQNNTDPITNEPLKDNSHLHHIDYNKQNDSRENLIFLNHSIHAKTNSNRDYWRIKLIKINNNINGGN